MLGERALIFLCSRRVFRGGAWSYNPLLARVANRIGYSGGDGISGLRLVRTSP